MAETRFVVETEALGKSYTSGTLIRALEGVSLTIAGGEFVAIRGPSGSGKTTLLNLIGTLDRPSAGRLVVDGVEVSALRGDALADFRREKIGFVFQLFNLLPALNALENVMLPLVPYRRGLTFKLETRARELLETMGLGSRLNHLPGQLSGGEQQRVAVARALINHPRLILADEPTGNLDTEAGTEILKVLRGLNQEQGITVLIVTHDAAIASQADRTVHLRDGRLLDADM